jgi:hypothetical protein
VWRSVEDRVEEAAPAPVEPPRPLPPEAEVFVDLIRAAGAQPVVEHGVLLGEVLGLEVVRVVLDDLGADLQVGVGRLDREAQRLLHGDRPPGDALAEAVRAVRQRRRADAPAHQVNQLAAERWLRAVLCAHPEQVAARTLAPAPPPAPRRSLRTPMPAAATGEDADGRAVVVVCSTGIDLDLVPTAADARLLDGRGARLVLAVPEGDDHPVTRELAAALHEPAEVIPIVGDWKALSVA